ncbi:hypothetical protein V8G54_014624 [Vigna mungo]|uniref:Integrase catalytic domain-containing protein n=1 Tax=Vigna mungo TaxID=3915 RepID=A0AAQ3NH06_VIGMU
MTKDIKRFVQQCQVCQRNKYDTAASPRLLQPLPVPDHVWQHITMDFIEGLPNSFGKQVIFVVVDRLSKAANFMALQHPYTALTVAQCFLDNIFKLHGFPTTITSDRDPIFISQFWKDFIAVQGVQTQLSTAYHPQTDGQTEVVNRCLETYLRCMCCDEPRQWSKWIPLAEWWYNTTYHSSIKASPYEVVYGQTPPNHLPYLPGESRVELFNRSLQKWEEILKLAKFHMKRAQERMKQLADKHISEREFQIGDLVYVKLHPYKQISVAFRNNAKLAPKYYGPYPILEKIGVVAYKVQLPVNSLIHNVFHVSHTSTNCPSTEEEATTREPEAILDRTTVKRDNMAVTKVLVKWKHQMAEDATWEFYYDLKRKFPNFKEGIDMGYPPNRLWINTTVRCSSKGSMRLCLPKEPYHLISSLIWYKKNNPFLDLFLTIQIQQLIPLVPFTYILEKIQALLSSPKFSMRSFIPLGAGT